MGRVTAALAVLAARPVPLVITDYHLSDMRGDELAATVKVTAPGALRDRPVDTHRPAA
jgi:hypothetical protein